MDNLPIPTQSRAIEHILLIEDDDDDVLIITERLEEIFKYEHEICVCSEKEEAISLLKSNRFDLCLLDHKLGYFSGIDVLSACENHRITAPIIMLTGQADEYVETHAIKKGAQDFIVKSHIEQDVFDRSIRYAISRKELEITRLANERAETENVAKDKFIAHLSHELRTPLTSILGYTSLLLENPLAAPMQKELSVINNNGKHLLNLLNDVLDLSKISAGKFELHARVTHLHQLLSEVCATLSMNAIDKGLSLECVSTNPIPQLIEVDELRLKQVLINLLGNAIKFTESGEVKLAVTNVNEEQLIMRIEDTGIGMPADLVQTIFQPFEQLEDVSNRRAGGAGLGLSISAEIVKRMGGKIEVDSVLHKGTAFNLQIPLIPSPDNENIDFDYKLHEQNFEKPKQLKLRGRALVVDDVFEIRHLLGHHVKSSGCEVEYARNGQDALDVLEQGQNEQVGFDLVLMDIHMPVMTGTEAMMAIKTQYPKLPVVAITAAIQKGTKENLRALGFQDVLAKPVEEHELQSILKKQLKKQAKKKKASVQSSASASRQNIIDANGSAAQKICLIEDDIDSAQIMKILLGKLGFEIVHFAKGRDFLKELPQLEKHVFLVDLGLPDIDGIELIEAINTEFKHAKTLVVSGTPVDEAFQQAYKLSGNLLKPISFEQLKAALADNKFA